MYAILGEKSVRIIDKNRKDDTISLCKFFENRSENYKIIIDRSNVNFSLEKITDCRIFDIYSVLRCKKRVKQTSEHSFIVSKNKYSLLKKSDFYIQTNAVNDIEILKRIGNQNNIFLIEHIIAEFCRNIVSINDNTWWLYVAEHISSGIKIVVGFGAGIIVSRILPLGTTNISKHVLQTIQYVRRQGFESNMKIISLITDMQISDFNIIVLNIKEVAEQLKMKNQEDTELFLMDFASIRPQIPRLFCSDNPFYIFVAKYIKEIDIFLSLCISVCILIFCILEYKISDINELIKSVKTFPIITVEDSSKTFKAQLNEENFIYIQEIINLLKDIQNPLVIFSKISELLYEVGISPNVIHMKTPKTINIPCVLNERQMKNLLKLSNDTMKITVIKTNPLKEEYEKIEERPSRSFGVEICIKIN